MVYIGGIVQSVSVLWNIHSTICSLKIIYLTFSVWAMLHAHSFKHLAKEIPDHGWSFYRQMRAANSLLMTTVLKKKFVFGEMPHSMQLLISFMFRSHQVKASLAMSCACVRLQLEAIQNWMCVSVATCSSPPACLTCQPRQLSVISWQMVWQCGPQSQLFSKEQPANAGFDRA